MWWQRVDKRLPKYSGWYQCTMCFNVETEDDPVYQTYVMDLYYYASTQRWRDNRQLRDGVGRDRTSSVLAWKKLPRPLLIEGLIYTWQRK